MNPRLRGDALLVPVRARGGRAVLPRIDGLSNTLQALLSHLIRRHRPAKVAGGLEAHLLPIGSGFGWIVLVGLGSDRPVKLIDMLNAGATSMEWCRSHGVKRAILAAGTLVGAVASDEAATWVEGAVLGGFRFAVHRTTALDDKPATSPTLIVASSGRGDRLLRESIHRARIAAECANLARSLGHEPPNVINPVSLARRAKQLARRYGLRCRVLDDRQMQTRKMGAILAVGRGSASPPRMIIMEYRPARSRARPVVLVGKAVTLDTGGYSIKPSASIAEMKYDKCGGMAVLGALVAASRLKLGRPVVGVIGAAENMISGDSYRPGDIVRAASGKTIEVLDTDAEGRLVLADCLHYACKTFSPQALIDLATLTGACHVALGDACAGLFAGDDRLASALIDAGEKTAERLWRLPLWPVYREQIAGTDADLKNYGGRPAGAVTAAMFLKEFVDDKVPWAHLDIAGVATTAKALPTCPIGATGFGVRLLIHYLRSRR